MSHRRNERVSPWYRDGLHFACTRCGKCCAGAHGLAWVTAAELTDVAVVLGTTFDDVLRKHVWLFGDAYAIKKRPATNACVFLADNRCAIYEVRPRQCRTFPFWQSTLATPLAWRAAAGACEGINRSAPLVPLDEIDAHLTA